MPLRTWEHFGGLAAEQQGYRPAESDLDRRKNFVLSGRGRRLAYATGMHTFPMPSRDADDWQGGDVQCSSVLQ